jgi:hypothetical protein
MAIELQELLTNPVFIVFLLFVVGAIFYTLRSYFKALLSAASYDYLIDGGFSFADELVGIGITGIDIGDWVAAGILFWKYRPLVGNWWALLFAAEAANFLLSLIPSIGEGIEVFFNLFPLVSLVILYKQYQANQIYDEVKDCDTYLKQENAPAEKDISVEVNDFMQAYSQQHYQDIMAKGKAVKKSILGQVKLLVEDKLLAVEKQLRELPKEQVDAFQRAIEQTQQEFDSDWRAAAQHAQELLGNVSAVVYQIQMQEQGKRAT